MSTSTGYPVVYCPEHPRSWSTGYVYVHVLVAERKLGRFLRKGEVVHHKDEDRFNFRRGNLVIKRKVAHARDHGFAKGRQMAVLCCPGCEKVFERPRNLTFLVGGRGSFTCCSSRCRGLFSKMIQLGDHRVAERLLRNVVRTYKRFGPVAQ